MKDVRHYFNDKNELESQPIGLNSLSDFDSETSKQLLISRIEKSIKEGRTEADEDDYFKSAPVLLDKYKSNYETAVNREFRDAIKTKHIIAYSLGHLANDLVITMWNTYSPWYLNQVMMFSDSDSGLIVLVGQIVDAFAQPTIGYSSDHTNWKLGKRMPWYLIGHFLTLPCFYLIFNPPEFAVGAPADDAASGLNPIPNLWFFLIVPSLMNIGQGAIQLSHMSIVNSITYD